MRLLLICLLTISSLMACGKKPDEESKPKPPVQVAPGYFAVPVVPDTLPAGENPFDEFGVDKPLVEMTVPPSDKPVTVRVYKRKTTLRERIFTNTPETGVVSSDPAVKPVQPKKPVVQRKCYLVAALILALVFILAWYWTRIRSWAGWENIMRLITRHKDGA